METQPCYPILLHLYYNVLEAKRRQRALLQMNITLTV